jgi:signal transduction histidine kinase
LLLGAIAVCALLIGYQLAVTLLRPAWIGPVTYWLRVALAWPTLLLAIYCSWYFSRARRPEALSCWMLSATILAYTIGQTMWTVGNQFLYHNGVPFPGLPDLFFVLAFLFSYLAIVLVPHRSWSLHLVMVLDGLLLMGAATALSWHFLVVPLFTDSGLTPLAKATSLAYPVCNLFMIFGLVMIYVRPLRYPTYVMYRPALLALLLADFCLVVGNSWGAVLLARPGHVYRTGDVPNLFRVIAFLLIPLALLILLRLEQRATRWGGDLAAIELRGKEIPKQDIGKSLRLFLPILAALLASALITVHATLTEQSAGWRGLLSPLAIAFALLLLVIVRQGVMSLEIARLQRENAVVRANEQALIELNRRKDEFLSALSHEIRTPLTSLQGYVQLAARRLGAWQPPAEADGTTASATVPMALVTRAVTQALSIVASCQESLHRLTRLAYDLVDDTHIRDGQLALHRAHCDLCALVRSAVEAERTLEPERVILLRTGCTSSADADTPLVVDADADRVAQVVINYLSNALKYSRADRPVEVVIEALLLQAQGQEEKGGHIRGARVARVAICDMGPGLSEADRVRVWERYPHIEEVSVQTGSGVSLGLGLHISKTIIERHGGQVGVESVLGQGSTFWFTLPLTTSPLLPHRPPTLPECYTHE